MTDKPEVQFLDAQLCFALYSCSKAIVGAYSAQFSKLGITYPQSLVVVSLLEQGEQSVGGLSKTLLLDSGTLTPLLKRMAGQNLIERTRSTKDERVVMVKLTKEGCALSDGIAQAQEDVSCGVAMPPDESEAFRGQIKALNLRLRAM